VSISEHEPNKDDNVVNEEREPYQVSILMNNLY